MRGDLRSYAHAEWVVVVTHAAVNVAPVELVSSQSVEKTSTDASLQYRFAHLAVSRVATAWSVAEI